jgi:hypothetical protein
MIEIAAIPLSDDHPEIEHTQTPRDRWEH